MKSEDVVAKVALLPLDEAIRQLRAKGCHQSLIRDSYISEDLFQNGREFAASAEFAEARKLLGRPIQGSTVLDLGAGNGIASYAFAVSGARSVYALEPNPSGDLGRGAIDRLTKGLPVQILADSGESISLDRDTVDVVYARQVLHHTSSLEKVLQECSRVLRPGGIMLACREHVVDNPRQLEEFLRNHPVHQLSGGENAFSLAEYTGAIRSACLEVEQILGPWDSVINAFPAVRNSEQLALYPRTFLGSKFGGLGRVLSRLPGMTSLVWRWLKRSTPGRLYSFVPRKWASSRPSGGGRIAKPPEQAVTPFDV